MGALQEIGREFQTRPIRMAIRLGVVVYVVGLIVTLVIGMFDHTPPIVIR